MRKLITLLTLSLFSLSAYAGSIKTEEVKYTVGGKEFTGYMAYDNSIKDKRPGILILHEWWGHDDYVRKRATMLAKLGYTAFALDMYGSGMLATHPKDAGKFKNAIFSDMKNTKLRMQKAHQLLKIHNTVNKDKTALLGYCMGGGLALFMARNGEDTDGVIVVHGSLGTKTPVKQGDIKGKVLVLNGDDDPFVPEKQVAAFEKEMNDANVDYKIINYPGARHAFTNPAATERGKKFSIPLAYNKKADKDSWKQIKKFLKEIF